VAGAAAIGALLVASGCIERTDTIHVHEDGSTVITSVFTGEIGDFSDAIALPAEPEWKIVQNYVDSSISSIGSNKPQRHLTATLKVPPGKPLPETFAAADDPDRDLHLQFPSEVRHWSEGTRTYYEFKRTYRARRFGCYNLAGSELWDQDLEDRVLDKGIFEVSQQDRDSYLEQYVTAYGYLQWRMLWQALGDLIKTGQLRDSTRTAIDSAAMTYLEENITSTRLLAILSLDEEKQGPQVDSMTAETEQALEEFVAAAVGRGELLAKFRASIDRVRADYRTTEALGGQSFAVNLRMPGTIVDANGLVDPGRANEVRWEFNGDDLHDRDLPLYALSVLEKR